MWCKHFSARWSIGFSSLVLLLSAFAPAAPKVTVVNDGRDLEPSALPLELSRSWVEVDFAAGEQLKVFDLTLEAPEAAKVIVGVSSEYLFAACASGRVAVDGRTVEPGEVIVWKHDAEYRPAVRRFSARDFESVLRDKGRTEVADAVKVVARAQKSERFWGTLRASSVNVGVPLKPAAERLRRGYLVQPAILEIRRGASEPVADATARAAARAIAAQDAEALAPLLTPAFFRDASKLGQFDPARLAMAKLVLSNLNGAKIDPTSLTRAAAAAATTVPASGPTTSASASTRPASVVAGTSSYQFTAGDRTVTIDVGGFDSGVFVTAIR